MKKIAIVVLVCLFAGVGAIEYEPRVENEVWIVKCSGYNMKYEAPARIALEKEIAMCSK